MEDMELLKAMLGEINANIKSNQEKAEPDRKADQENLLTRLVAKIETNQEERKAERKPYRQDLKRMLEEMLRDKQDKMDSWLTEKQDGRKELTACQEATEANPEKLKTCQEKTELDTGMMQSVEEHQEVPKEEAAVMLVGGLR
jgi:hypothetical protein